MDVKQTRRVTTLLLALSAKHTHRLTVSQIAARSHVSSWTVRRALTDLEATGLVQQAPMPTRSTVGAPRAGYWLTAGGAAYVAGLWTPR